MVIDAHTHMHHRSYVEWLKEKGGAEGRRRAARMEEAAKVRPHSLDVRLRLAQLDRNSIDLQVVTPGGGGNLSGEGLDPLAVARVINDGMAKLAEESKGRLIAVGTVPLTGFKRGGSKEMTRAVKGLGCRGITIPSHVQGKPLDSPQYEPFWAQAAEMGTPVFIHPVSPDRHRDRGYEGDYDLSHNFGWPFETILALSRLVFSGIMERYPSLKIVGHHLGGGMPFFWGRTNESYDLTNPLHATVNKAIGEGLSKPLFSYFSSFYYDTAIGGSAAAVRCAHDVFGADHLIFATDAPQGPGDGEIRLATYPGIIRSLGLSKKDTEKILGQNAREMLGLR
jgi:predicted TIM-barrel fold metal-dependent hydrolase